MKSFLEKFTIHIFPSPDILSKLVKELSVLRRVLGIILYSPCGIVGIVIWVLNLEEAVLIQVNYMRNNGLVLDFLPYFLFQVFESTERRVLCWGNHIVIFEFTIEL